MFKRRAFIAFVLSVAACGGSGTGTRDAIGPDPAASPTPVTLDGGDSPIVDGGTTPLEDGAVPPQGDGSAAPPSDAGTPPVGPGTDPTNASGTRLKTRVIVGADGSRQAIGLHDTMYDVDCSFQMASDGHFRCLPTVGVTAGAYFRDGTCQTPLAVAASGCSATTWALYPVTACGTTQIHVYKGTSSYTGPVFVGSPGACGSITPPTNVTLFSMPVAEFPAEAFVAGTVQLQ